jgi:hypothetical protein
MPGNDRPWLLTWQNAEVLMAQGPFRHAIPAGRSATLIYDGERLAVSVSLGQDDDPAQLPALPQAIHFEVDRRLQTLNVTCSEPELHKYFYAYVCHALELIREQRQPAVLAFRESWVRTRELLEQQIVLSRDKQLGLLGELVFLSLVAERHAGGWGAAFDSWHRDANAEHDFAFGTADVEVKTTSKEARVHMIGSLDQLRASPGRNLFLLSLQFSAAPPHADGSVSLNEKINEIFGALQARADLSSRFRERLARAGWNEEHRTHYDHRVIQRSSPKIIQVDDKFPRLTPENLTGLPNELIIRIRSVVYSIDVTGLGSDFVPELLTELIS